MLTEEKYPLFSGPMLFATFHFLSKGQYFRDNFLSVNACILASLLVDKVLFEVYNLSVVALFMNCNIWYATDIVNINFRIFSPRCTTVSFVYIT